MIDQTLRTTVHLTEEERPWAPGEGGASMRLLSVAASTGTWVIQTRLPAGLAVPTHLHTGRVYAFTLRGSWGYAEYDWVAEAGSFIEEQAGVSHSLVVPDGTGEAEVIYVVEGANLYFAPDGTYLFHEDGSTMLRMYLAACAANGIVPPTDIVR